MKYFSGLSTTEVGIVIASLCLGIIFFTLVMDDYGALAYYNMPAGQFSNYPHIDHHYTAFLFVNSIYKMLSAAFPMYYWMGIAFMVFQILALYLILRSIKINLLRFNQPLHVIWVIQILFACFFFENILILSHTRFSLLFCGISLFNLVFAPEVRKRDVIFNTALFILGMLHRPESSMGTLLLISAGYLLYHFDLKHLTKRIFFPAAATVLLFGAIAIDWAHTDIYVRKIEPEIEYKIMDRRVVSIAEMKTPQDSVKYEAAMVGMWFDTNVMTPKFLRSIILPGINLSPAHAAKVFFHVLSLYRYYTFVPLTLLVCILLCLFIPLSRWRLLKIVAFQVCVFAIIYALDFNGRLVAGRHFLNLQIMALLITAFYFFSSNSANLLLKLDKRMQVAFLLLILSGVALTAKEYKQENETMASEVQCYESAMREIESVYSGRIIVATLSDVYLLNHNFSLKSKNYTSNTYIMYDLFNYSLIPEYQNYLGSLCSCNPTDPVAFFEWLTKKNALYLSNSSRRKLTEKYMRVIHGQPLKISPVDSISKPTCINFTIHNDYELNKIEIEK